MREHKPDPVPHPLPQAPVIPARGATARGSNYVVAAGRCVLLQVSHGVGSVYPLAQVVTQVAKAFPDATTCPGVVRAGLPVRGTRCHVRDQAGEGVSRPVQVRASLLLPHGQFGQAFLHHSGLAGIHPGRPARRAPQQKLACGCLQHPDPSAQTATTVPKVIQELVIRQQDADGGRILLLAGCHGQGYTAPGRKRTAPPAVGDRPGSQRRKQQPQKRPLIGHGQPAPCSPQSSQRDTKPTIVGPKHLVLTDLQFCPVWAYITEHTHHFASRSRRSFILHSRTRVERLPLHTGQFTGGLGGQAAVRRR